MSDNTKQIEQFENDLKKRVKDLQRSILRTAITGLLSFVLSGDRTEFNVSNIGKSGRVAARVRATGRRKRKGLLKFIVDSLLSLFDNNKEFYQGEGSTKSVDDAARKKVLLLYGYDIDEGKVLPGGYLDETLNMGGVAQQIGGILNGQLAARASLTDIRRNLIAALSGKSGLVDSHFRRFTRDLFAEYDRAVKLEYKEQLGLKHAVYAGTAIDDTRDFCVERLNNVYTEEEINNWNDEEWQGKKPGDVKIVLGGYNCRHHLNWVSEGTAKAIAKQRGGINNYN